MKKGSGGLFRAFHILLQAENTARMAVNEIENRSGFDTLFLAKQINLVKGEGGHSDYIFGRKEALHGN